MRGVINADPDQAVKSYRSLRLLSVVLIVCSIVGYILGHGWLTLVCAIFAALLLAFEVHISLKVYENPPRLDEDSPTATIRYASPEHGRMVNDFIYFETVEETFAGREACRSKHRRHYHICYSFHCISV